MRRQKWKEALQYLNQAEKLAPQVSGIRLNIGLVHYRQGDYGAAILDFEAVLKEQSGSIQARRLLGLCYLFEERYNDAAVELEPLWPGSSTDVTYLYSLAVAAGNSNRHGLEERATRQLMDVGNDSPLVHLLLGKAYMAHEDYDHALVELLKASDADKKLPMLHYNLGVVYRHKGEMERARTEFLEDKALEPSVAFNYDELGMLSSLDGKDGEAESYFTDAIKRDPRISTAWFGLAKLYRQEKRYDDALRALSQAGAIDPDSASVHYLRGQVFSALHRKNEATEEFAAVQRLKKETVDKLERQVSGAKYLDPELRNQ